MLRFDRSLGVWELREEARLGCRNLWQHVDQHATLTGSRWDRDLQELPEKTHQDGSMHTSTSMQRRSYWREVFLATADLRRGKQRTAADGASMGR